MAIKLHEDFSEDEMVDVYMLVNGRGYRNGFPCDLDEELEEHRSLGCTGAEFLKSKGGVIIISRGDEPSEEDMTINPDGSKYDRWAKERAEAKAQGYYGFQVPPDHPNCRCSPFEAAWIDEASNLTPEKMAEALAAMMKKPWK